MPDHYSTYPVTAFYKRGSQDKYFCERRKLWEVSSWLPAYVMWRGSEIFSSLGIFHRASAVPGGIKGNPLLYFAGGK
jgi:hypothetical protein